MIELLKTRSLNREKPYNLLVAESARAPTVTFAFLEGVALATRTVSTATATVAASATTVAASATASSVAAVASAAAAAATVAAVAASAASTAATFAVLKAAAASAVTFTSLECVASATATSSAAPVAITTTLPATAITVITSVEALLLGILAGLAAHRLVLKSFFGVKFLLADGENELRFAVTAIEGFILELTRRSWCFIIRRGRL